MIRHLSRCVGLVVFCLLATGGSVETTPRRQLAVQPRADLGAAPAAGHPVRAARPPVSQSRAGLLRRLPLAFERNEGQVDPSVKFFSRGLGYMLFLTADETVLALRGSERESSSRALNGQRAGVEATVRMRLVGANANPRVVGEKELRGRVNYLIGNDPAKWHSGIRTYAQVRAENVYDGVDYVTGMTLSGSGFPSMCAAVQPSKGQLGVAEWNQFLANGNQQVLMARYSAKGVRVASAILGGGGSAVDSGFGIAVGGTGKAFVAGTTGSATFIAGTLQVQPWSNPNCGFGQSCVYDGFVAMLDTSSCATDLFVRKSVDKNFALVGDTLTYTITITNNGNTSTGKATNVELKDTLPSPPSSVTDVTFISATPSSGTCSYTDATKTVDCTFAEIKPGDIVPVDIKVTIDGDATTQGVIKNTAGAFAKDQVELDPSDNTSLRDVNVVTALAYLSITKDAPKQADAGPDLT